MTDDEGAKKHQKKDKAHDEGGSGIEPGSLVLADFSGWIEETDELFDTTDESLAKEKDIFDEKIVYGAQPLIVGKGRLFPGLDEHMLAAEIGKDYEAVIPPEKGAGPRDPKLVELHPMREFLRQDIEPQVGMEVTVRNRKATIVAMTAGRVRIDFNNRLAGRTLKYKYKIISKPDKPKEIAELLLKMSYGTAEGFDVHHHGKEYRITLPDACKYDQKWLLTKYRVVTDMRDVLDADKVSFVEEYLKPKVQEEEPEFKPEPEAKAETADEPKDGAKEEEVSTEPEEKAPEELSDEDRQ
ncbi:MAG: FKBP-type peptidyl-prolyl cis-trans isomerase [Methanobacteriota archaeon]|nr:MAG: FKBP-type peptidyl-prolyl cis-trans isomerase [Euryarchaeota archaeon]